MDLSRRRLLIGGGLLVAAPVIVRAASLMVIRGEPLIITPPPLIEYDPLDPSPHFVLNGKQIVRCKPGFEGLVQWAKFLERIKERKVAFTDLPDGSYVSTVFLGIDHGFPEFLEPGERVNYQPVLFETMVFGGPNNEKTLRYCTWDEAAAGHRDAVAFERQRVIALENKS